MRKVQEVLRLLLVCGLSQRQTSRTCGVGRASVAEYLERAQRAGLLGTAWESWSDEELDRRLYPPARRPVRRERPAVDWLQVHEELKGKNVTLSLVWQEYEHLHPLPSYALRETCLSFPTTTVHSRGPRIASAHTQSAGRLANGTWMNCRSQ